MAGTASAPGAQFPGTFTISGVYRVIDNPRRKWWTFWRPRRIQTDELQTFHVPMDLWTVHGFNERDGNGDLDGRARGRGPDRT